MLYYSKSVSGPLQKEKKWGKSLQTEWYGTQFQFGAKRARGKTTNQIVFWGPDRLRSNKVSIQKQTSGKLREKFQNCLSWKAFRMPTKLQLFWKRNIDRWWCKLWRFYKWHCLSWFSGGQVGIRKWEAISVIEKMGIWVNK